MRAAALRMAPAILLGALPVVVVITMFVTAVRTDSLSVDFGNELYPEAKEILAGRNPFPEPGSDLSSGKNFIWPPVAALVVAPLTSLDPGAADVAIAAVGLACFGLALWLVGVTDWRVYGASALWPPVVGEMRVSHFTLVLCVLLAIVWRRRESPLAGGTLGMAVAIKLFLWPIGVWVAAIGRLRVGLLAAAIALGSLLLVLPFTSLHDYIQTLLELGRTFDQDSYNPYGLLVQLGAPEVAARVIGLLVGGALLVATWRTKSFTIAVASALALSPIVWLDYYALLAVPLAVALPRFSPVWLVPIATWGLLSAGIGAGNGWGTTRALLAFTIVGIVSYRAERAHATIPSNPGAGWNGVDSLVGSSPRCSIDSDRA